MELTLDQLTGVFRSLSREAYAAYLPPLNRAMQEFSISTPIRIAHFLGQLGEESGGLQWMEEIWGPTPAQRGYEGRADLGNVQAGDGYRYRGRGPIQLTGRSNYRVVGAALGIDLEGDPDRASAPDVAFRIAARFWGSRDLNYYADQGDAGWQEICRRVNGAYPPNGEAGRWAYYTRAKSVLGVASATSSKGGRVSFAKVILAAKGDLDGRVASLMQFVLAKPGRGIEADVVREWAIAEANAACWPTPVGTYDFAVIGVPALEALPNEVKVLVLPDTPANRKKSDYRNLCGISYEGTVRELVPAFLDRLSPGAGKEYLEAVGATLSLPEAARPAPEVEPARRSKPAKPPKPAPPKPAPAKPAPAKPASTEDLVERAVAFGRRLLGTPYGNGWAAGTWPDGPSLYARCDPKVHTVEFIRANAMICSAFVNVIRAHVAGLPAVGRNQGDAWPGGTAAIGRTFARMSGARPYPPVANTPRGWLVFSPYLGPEFVPFRQGHVGIALGDGKVLEARVPATSEDRTEDQGHQWLLTNGGGLGYTTIIPPEVWLKV